MILQRDNSKRSVLPRVLIVAISTLTALYSPPSTQAQIVLRDLSIIRDKTVVDFDQDNVELSDGSSLEWDQILQANVGPEQQAQFDQNISEIGLPLFRLKSRIKLQDWAGAGEIAEPLVDELENPSNQDFAYLVHLVSMKSRLIRGDRAGALWNFLQAAELQPQCSPAIQKIVANGKLKDSEIANYFSNEILPIWFDLDRAKDISDRLNKHLLSDSQMKSGPIVYLASMQLALGQRDRADALIRQLDGRKELAPWQMILRSRLAWLSGDSMKSQTILNQNAAGMSPGASAVADYYRGTHVLTSREPSQPGDATDIERSAAMLTLIRVPANFGGVYPHLSAAALFQAAEIAKVRGLEKESKILTAELTRRYPRTFHGSKKTAQISK